MVRLFLVFFCLFFASKSFLISENTAPIHIVYHVCTLNNWEAIVKEQVVALENSGLGKACDSLTVTVVGPDFDKAPPLFEKASFFHKTKVINAGFDLHLYEFPGIEKVQQIAKDSPNSKILYFHSKGVTYFGHPCEEKIHCWRRYMEYFSVYKWKNCVDALDTVQACGVDWGLAACNIPCFAGNYWWARADYIPQCTLYRNSRFDCEIFIGTGKPTVKNFLLSGRNPRLKEFLTPKQIKNVQLFPPTVFWHQGMFNFEKFLYKPHYYQDR